MINVDRCCLNCAYLKSGLCGLFEIVPYPVDKIDCANFTPKVNRISEVTEDGKIVKQTVFEHITESVAVLADKLVYYIEGEHSPFGRRWKSTLTGDVCYVNRSSAVEATIKELKKETKEQSK